MAKVLSIICYIVFFICGTWSLSLYVWYRVRKHKERKAIEKKSDEESEAQNNEQER